MVCFVLCCVARLFLNAFVYILCYRSVNNEASQVLLINPVCAWLALCVCVCVLESPYVYVLPWHMAGQNRVKWEFQTDRGGKKVESCNCRRRQMTWNLTK